MSSPSLNYPEKVKGQYRMLPSEKDARDCACDCQEKSIGACQGHDEENERLVDKSEETKTLDRDSEDLPKDSDIVIIPPDGGWGWLIVGASFVCNLVVDGIIFSFGTFLVSIADEFDVSKAEVTLVGSLMSGFYLIAGPFASAMANGYGFRLVAIMGSVLGAAAFAVSNFATSVTFLCATYGVIGGIGFGFIYVPSIISISFYFERWRALATGIAVCGSGIGTFLFAPLSEFLINRLGWRGALLCQGALVLGCVICGLMFRPLKPTNVLDYQDEDQETAEPTDLPLTTKLKMEEAIESMKNNAAFKYLPDHQASLPAPGMKENTKFPRIWEVYRPVPNAKSVPDTIQSFAQSKTTSVPFLAEKRSPHQNSKLILHARKRTVSENHDRYESVGPLCRDDIFYAASLTRLSQYNSKTSIAYNLSVTKVTEEKDVGSTCELLPKSFWAMMNTMLDFSLMKSPSFLILAIGGFFTMMGFYVPYMYLVERATDRGIDQTTAVWLLSAIGIANTVGRVLCGVISSFPRVNALFLTNLALTVGGISTMLSGLSASIEYQLFYSVVFGLATSCFASLRSIVVVDLLGLEKLTNAFGLLLMFQGVAAIIGAPLAGAFMNYTGNYDACFYLSGGVLLFSAVMCYPLNCVNKWEKSAVLRLVKRSSFRFNCSCSFFYCVRQ